MIYNTEILNNTNMMTGQSSGAGLLFYSSVTSAFIYKCKVSFTINNIITSPLTKQKVNYNTGRGIISISGSLEIHNSEMIDNNVGAEHGSALYSTAINTLLSNSILDFASLFVCFFVCLFI